MNHRIKKFITRAAALLTFRRLRVWEIWDGAGHWVLHYSAKQAIKLAQYEEMCSPSEEDIESVECLSDEQARDLPWHDEGKMGSPDTTLGLYMDNHDTSYPQYLGCTEY